ncbi:MAG: hypothetical protein Kow0027_30940 [Saprospiraceae bacterium]
MNASAEQNGNKKLLTGEIRSEPKKEGKEKPEGKKISAVETCWLINDNAVILCNCGAKVRESMSPS